MRHREHPTGRALLAAFTAVAVTFAAGIVISQGYVRRILAAAEDITGNSSPSIEMLSSMRTTVRTLGVLVDDYIDLCVAGTCGPVPPRLEYLRRELAAEWASYKRLPTFPGEPNGWPAVDAELARFGDALDSAFADLEHGLRQRAKATLNARIMPYSDRLDAALASLAEYDHDQGLKATARIGTLAQHSIVLSVVLSVIGLGLTALAAFFSIRFVRGYERALQRRADDLDQFAGRVAHDVLSPLTTTTAALHVARQDSSEPGRRALDRGNRSLERVQQVVKGLLEFARAGGRPASGGSADVATVLHDVVDEVRQLAEEQHVRVVIENTATGTAACSMGVLTSVVGNMVRNAIKYMGESRIREVRLRAAIVRSGTTVRTEIEDSGPGIPDSLGQRVFEAFVRGDDVEQSGAGLGLATAKRLVTAHGGRIGFFSKPGRGTLFWFELPVAPLAE